MPDLKCEILETLVEFPGDGGKFHKELNLVQWGKNSPKYDLRGWSEDRAEMTKGITLTREELLFLKDELSKIKL